MQDEQQKMEFQYLPGAQRTAEWYALRIGKITASRLDDWLSVSKAKKTLGAPLQPRKDYELELMYERQFNVSYNNYVSDAMLDGVELEDWARRQYVKITGNSTDPVGAWFNDLFVASPDSAVYPKGSNNSDPENAEGLLEIKIVRDNTFSQILKIEHDKNHFDELPEGDEIVKRYLPITEKHWRQVQGQLWASGKKWCDYVAVNLNTKKIKITRIFPNTEFHEWLELAVPEPITVQPFSNENLYDISGEIPQGIHAEDNTGEPTPGRKLGW